MFKYSAIQSRYCDSDLTQCFGGCGDLTFCWIGQLCFDIDVGWFSILQGCADFSIHVASDLLHLAALEGVWLLKVLHLFILQCRNFCDFYFGTD